MISFTPKSTKYERTASVTNLNTWKVSHIVTNSYPWKFSVHAAGNYTLAFLKKGIFQFKCFYRSEVIRDNGIICIAPSQTFCIQTPDGAACDFYIVEFDCNNFPFFELKNYLITSTSKTDEELFSEYESSYIANEHDYVVDSHLIRILNHIQQTLKTNPEQRLLVNKIRNYICEHISENLTANDVASVFGYNKDYLARILKQNENTTLKKMLIAERLRIAKNLLVFSDYSMAVISNQIGFSSSIEFHKFFKYHTKITPTNYRMTRSK